jgi:hypothetical protein
LRALGDVAFWRFRLFRDWPALRFFFPLFARI